MIESRGNDNRTVTSSNGVLTSDITNAVIEYKSIEWITTRYPVTEDEIFEAIDYFADTTEDAIDHKSIKFKNHGTPDDIDLETRMITDSMFFKVVQYGKVLYPELTCFDVLYSKGLAGMIADVYTDLEKGITDFEVSPAHNAVYTGVRNELGDLPPSQVLENFDRDNYNNGKYSE